MLRAKDYLLIAVTFSAIFFSVAFPDVGAVFAPFPKYCMMAILFLSFLSLPLDNLTRTLRGFMFKIIQLTILKLILLPLFVFFIFRMVLPEYALAAMLLSGVSTGVVSPFFAGLLGANTSLILVLVAVSSILVPFTLPCLVKILAGRTLEISLPAMIQLLAAVIFIPFLLAETLRRLVPRLVVKIEQKKFGLSLVLFAVTNMGIFANYADFFRSSPYVVLTALAVAVALAGIYFMGGLLSSLKQPVDYQLSVILSFGIMNNVLVMVFSAEFFTPLEPTVAAVYTIPFYGLIIPLRLYQSRRNRPTPI